MKARKTTAKAVKQEIAKGGTGGMSALYGTELHNIEIACHYLLQGLECRRENDPQNNARTRCLNESISVSRDCISQSLLLAVIERDAETLYKVANFIENWKPNKSPEDEIRWEIIVLKERCKLAGQQMTLIQVKHTLHNRYGRIIKNTADGSSYLRRLCKELDFPLISDRRGRPKNKT